MKLMNLLAAATAFAAIAAGAASAQPYGPPRNQNGSYGQPDTNGYNNQRDPNNYYSQMDQNGFYDRNGRYQRTQRQNDRRGDAGGYYQQGAYEQNCQRGNQVAGTIFGALAGGLIGNAVSHGNGGAVAGGAVLGGLFGNTISKDIDCNDQPYAFGVYSNGLNGDIGRRYDWNHGQSRGYFTPTRAYNRSGLNCRDFTETTYRDGHELTHNGTACRAQDGNWNFD